jgi:hypothetical protein
MKAENEIYFGFCKSSKFDIVLQTSNVCSPSFTNMDNNAKV